MDITPNKLELVECGKPTNSSSGLYFQANVKRTYAQNTSIVAENCLRRLTLLADLTIRQGILFIISLTSVTSMFHDVSNLKISRLLLYISSFYISPAGFILVNIM